MSTGHSSDYQVIGQQAQRRVLESIPEQWRLSAEAKKEYHSRPQEASSECGLLTKRQSELTSLTASQLLNRIHSRELTSYEVTEAFCARAAIAHQLVNCLVEFFPGEAMEQARTLDDSLASGGQPVGPLHGLPITIKDIMNVKGRTTTMGFVAWHNVPPSTADASVVKTMRDAGAIIFGRTTCPQSGMAIETVSNLWGRTLNAFNPRFGSGGSSGGEAALVALHGAPASPLSTDIGGSIRAPAAFNGLYGMRPTYERVPRTGFVHPALGNLSIKSAAGPACHSMEDLKLFIKLIVTHPTLPYEPTCTMPYWNELAPTGDRKLRIGLMLTDGAVEPHPPVLRGLRSTAEKLRAAGHEIVDFIPPFDCWEAALTTFALFFQTGAKEAKALLQEAGEPPIKQFAYNLEALSVKDLTAAEAFYHNRKQAGYRAAFQEAWDAAKLDVLLCPVAPMAGVPHDFCVWWGYTALFNMLDYPSAVVPLKGFKISPEEDPKDVAYKPKDNPFDRPNWEAYDPQQWTTQPVTIQVVGRPFRDEQLIADVEVVDKVVNAVQG